MLVSPVLYRQMCDAAGREGVSLQVWALGAFRDRVVGESDAKFLASLVDVEPRARFESRVEVLGDGSRVARSFVVEPFEESA